MKKLSLLLLAVLLVLTALTPLIAQAAPGKNACWGQASAVFAHMGVMGEHASQQPTPRVGLRNLARLLYADGVIPDDSLGSLGAFVAEVLGLSIDACLS